MIHVVVGCLSLEVICVEGGKCSVSNTWLSSAWFVDLRGFVRGILEGEGPVIVFKKVDQNCEGVIMSE